MMVLFNALPTTVRPRRRLPCTLVCPAHQPIPPPHPGMRTPRLVHPTVPWAAEQLHAQHVRRVLAQQVFDALASVQPDSGGASDERPLDAVGDLGQVHLEWLRLRRAEPCVQSRHGMFVTQCNTRDSPHHHSHAVLRLASLQIVHLLLLCFVRVRIALQGE